MKMSRWCVSTCPLSGVTQGEDRRSEPAGAEGEAPRGRADASGGVGGVTGRRDRRRRNKVLLTRCLIRDLDVLPSQSGSHLIWTSFELLIIIIIIIIMGALHSLPDEPQYVDLAEKTGFSLEQIEILHRRFKQLSHNEETLRRQDLSTIPDLACNPIRSQIIEAFFDRRNFRQSGVVGTEQEIGFAEFLVVLSHFRPPSLRLNEDQRENIRMEKLRFLFNMHDTDNDGTITLEEYRHVVEELLSRSGALGKETAKGIADAAMLEVASISMGHMEPDEFYEGITFEHFNKLLKDFEIESRMNIRFMNMDTTTLCK
ncbi:hypothetical protein NHX12_027126 [Muraenolepis orangiensis]|uniref:Calcineurin B homologous protein 3 n=1 Tax=Muraenolepis orangiensis TaxID=630683 RepID=A0A9Q0EE11_9TELE|nr:hypothetical protein NHX12_027126 [Muraenolepis orangiensis]